MSSDFWKGAGVTLAVLAGMAVIPDVIHWVAVNPVLDRVGYWVTTPLFSIYDIGKVVIWLVILYVLIWTAAFGPRP